MPKLKSAAVLGGLTLAAAGLPAMAQDMDALVAAAKAEGTLTTIALPHDWCGYGDVIEGFKAKYPASRSTSSTRTRVRRTNSRRSAPTRTTPGRRRRT